MSKSGRDVASKGSTDAFDKFFGDAPTTGHRNGKKSKNGKKPKNGNSANGVNGHSTNGVAANGITASNGNGNGKVDHVTEVVDVTEVVVDELEVADLDVTELDTADLDFDADLDVTQPRDPEPAHDGADADDDTDEHPILPRDATGEYVLPDTVPVEPHDDVDARDTDDGVDDDATMEVATVVTAPPPVVDERDVDVTDDVDEELKILVRSDDEDFVGDDLGDDVSDHILEELRRADIDGPVVPVAPQDESTSMRRRPRRAADYDPAPVPIPARVPRVLGRKPRVRKVTRVVRHVDPWSVFKVAIVANIVLYIIVLTASVLLWNVANATGTVQNVERFFESFGWNSFEFNGGELYHAGWVAGLFVVVGLTGLAVLAATLFNLITDLVGGVRFTVLEEEVVETRTSPMRRFVVRRSEPETPAVVHDANGMMIREAVVDDTGANVRPTR